MAKKTGILGGDARMRLLSQMLAQDGYEVCTWELPATIWHDLDLRWHVTRHAKPTILWCREQSYTAWHRCLCDSMSRWQSQNM